MNLIFSICRWMQYLFWFGGRKIKTNKFCIYLELVWFWKLKKEANRALLLSPRLLFACAAWLTASTQTAEERQRQEPLSAPVQIFLLLEFFIIYYYTNAILKNYWVYSSKLQCSTWIISPDFYLFLAKVCII